MPSIAIIALKKKKTKNKQRYDSTIENRAINEYKN